MAEAEPRKKMIISLGGAFNPVHTQHVHVMQIAREWINRNTNFEVIAGLLAVAPDGYVKGKANKLNQKAMKAEHRIQLCNIACKEHRAWLSPYPKPCGSALEACKKVQSDLHREGQIQDLVLGVIVGADRAVNKSGKTKWSGSKPPDHITICIGREGETEALKTRLTHDLKENKVTYPDSFILVPEEARAVSSTQIRKVLSDVHNAETKEQKMEYLNEVLDKKMLTEELANYLLENELNLYL